jgi:uncharacterized protein with NRDE domain
MQRDGHPMSNTMNGGRFGDATNWAANAQAIGIPTTTVPTLGAVIQSTAVGHVAYTEIPGAPSTVEDYNWNRNGVYLEHTWAPPDQVFIVFGPVPGPVDGLHGDVNGDGLTDLVAVNVNSVFVMLSTGSSFGPSTQWLSTSSPAPYGTRATLLADVTGSGKADLVAVNDGNTYVMLSTGTGFSAPALWSSTPFYGTRATLLADVTGNGRADLVAVNDNQTFVMLSTGTGFSAPALWSSTPFYGTRATLLGDVTGDRKADLVAVNDTGSFVMPSTGTTFGPPHGWSGTSFYGTRATLVGDVNNDGKLDLVAVNENSVWVMLSSGTGFGSSTQWLSTSSPPPYGTRATLLGSEIVPGWADLVAVNDVNTYVMASGRTSFGTPTVWASLPFYGSRATL